MSALQDWIHSLNHWIYSLNPTVAFLVMGAIFLVASIASWYAGDLIIRLRGRR